MKHLCAILCFIPVFILAQLSPGACVHGKGLQYYLDTYLASLGACNCQRSGVFLTSFSKCDDDDPYVIDFEDNFDGDSLDLSKWQLSPSSQGALEGAQRIELSTLKNVSVENGICHIIAKKETVTSRAVNYRDDNELLEDGKENLRTFEYTSSLLVTRNTYFYGKYEIRCRMPKGNGFWPAFWTFGGTRYNEIDFFDSYAGIHEVINCIYHDNDGDGKPTGCNYSVKGYDLSEWHTFTCLFEEDQITFFVDGHPTNIIYRVITETREPVLCKDNIANGTYFQLDSYPIEPMKIIINLALISKNGPGGSIPVDASTPFPSSFDVDYVKMWKRVKNEFTVYPNPSHGQIRINSSTTKITFVEICSLNGTSIYKSKTDGTSLYLDLSSIPDGIYYAKLTYNGGQAIQKIIKIST